MKKMIPTICLMLLLWGCIPLASDLQKVGNKTQLLSTKIDAYQEAMSPVLDKLVEDGVVKKEWQDKITEEIDKIQPVIEEVAVSIKNAPYTDDAFENIVIGALEGAKASKDFIPYSEIVIPALGLIALFLEKKRRDEKGNKEVVTAKYTAHKQGEERFKLSHAELASELYDDIGKARARNGV